MTDHQKTYEDLYASDYRQELNPFEIARAQAIAHFVRSQVLRDTTPKNIIDYGAGTGMFSDLWFELFPKADIKFCDISSNARNNFCNRIPEKSEDFHLIVDGKADFPDGTFDLVISIEVMEHVEDVYSYLADIHRLLKPGGLFVWTTPCGNPFSLEHLWASVSGQISSTKEGGRLFGWDDPTHLRRMTTAEAEKVIMESGFALSTFRWHRHFFSYLCEYVFPGAYRFRNFYTKIMQLDYFLFRRFSNGASMIGLARKT